MADDDAVKPKEPYYVLEALRDNYTLSLQILDFAKEAESDTLMKALIMDSYHVTPYMALKQIAERTWTLADLKSYFDESEVSMAHAQLENQIGITERAAILAKAYSDVFHGGAG